MKIKYSIPPTEKIRNMFLINHNHNIEYANSVEGQTIIAGSGRTVPSLIAVAESDAFLNPNQLPSRSRVWLDTIPTLQIVPVISNWQEVESIASDEIERAFYSDITVEEAANLAFTRTEEYFQLGVYRNDN